MTKPECFSIWWENISGPAGDKCRECALKDECFVSFATTTLPEARELHPGASLESLAELLEVNENAVLLAMAYTAPTKQSRQTPVKTEKKIKKKKKKVKKKKTGKRTWGKGTFEKRWNKERERNPVIAQLTPGTKLEKEHNGEVYTATVKKGGYVCGKQTFPTLNTLTQHIAGSNARRSPVKFWKLTKED